MRRSSTDETPYRRSPSLDSKTGSPPFCFGSEREHRGAPFGFSFRTAPGTKTAKAGYATAQGRKYVVFYLDLSFIFLLELRRCRMAEGCMRALRYAMVFFNLLFW
ncbi:tetraspanin-4a isoform X1, partial [Tachysurus ichikawai]